MRSSASKLTKSLISISDGTEQQNVSSIERSSSSSLSSRIQRSKTSLALPRIQNFVYQNRLCTALFIPLINLFLHYYYKTKLRKRKQINVYNTKLITL